jgi:hypothetical protein
LEAIKEKKNNKTRKQGNKKMKERDNFEDATMEEQD